VHDLRVELDAVEPPTRVLEGGDGSRGRRPGDDCSRRRRDDSVAMAHPDDLLLGQAGEERAAAAV
jgi:hypothetical protein